MSQREYWSEAMEKRYKRRRLELWPKLPLKGHFFQRFTTTGTSNFDKR